MAEELDNQIDSDLEALSDEELSSSANSLLASWSIPEFHKHDRGRMWYFYFILVTVALLWYSYFTANPLFAIIIILFLIIYFISERGTPKNLSFSITVDGIMIENRLINWRDLQNFYILYYPPMHKNLYFQPKNSLRSLINIPLENQNPVEVRQILLNFLPEDLQKEEISPSEGISKLLKL